MRMSAMFHADVFAGILVGGRATRLGGRDKARLVRDDGRTFLEHIVASLRGRVCAVRLAGHAEQRYPDVDLELVPDRVEGKGPLAALDALLATPPAAPPATWCMLIACDMPAFDPAVIDVLAAARTAGALAVIPRAGGRLHPTCALYARGVAALVAEMLAGADRSLHGLIGRAGEQAVIVDVPAALRASFANVNDRWPA